MFGHNEHEIPRVRELCAELDMTFNPKISWDDEFSPVRDKAYVLRETGLQATPAEHEVQLAEGQPEDWLQQADAKMPFGRILRPEDLAKLIAYLFSDDAQMMTGSLIDFDQQVIGAFD